MRYTPRIVLPIKRKRLLFGCGFALLAACLLGIVLDLPHTAAFRWLHSDDVVARAVSPDGKAIATARYYDTLTFGYYHVTLERPGTHPFGLGVDEVAEFAAEGFERLDWKDAKTLRVFFDATKHKDHLEDTAFVRQMDTWQDVTIVYIPAYGK